MCERGEELQLAEEKVGKGDAIYYKSEDGDGVCTSPQSLTTILDDKRLSFVQGHDRHRVRERLLCFLSDFCQANTDED